MTPSKRRKDDNMLKKAFTNSIIPLIVAAFTAYGAFTLLKSEVQNHIDNSDGIHMSFKDMTKEFVQDPEFNAMVKSMDRLHGKMDKLIFYKENK